MTMIRIGLMQLLRPGGLGAATVASSLATCHETRQPSRREVVGGTGFEPVTSSV